MAILNLRDSSGFLTFDQEECGAVGESLHDRYVNADPFPHIVLDNFIDVDVLRRVQAEFPSSEGHVFFDRSQERLKHQYGPAEWTGFTTRNLFAELNSNAMLTFLEKMTGITGLITDPAFEGGGLHETKRTGRLGIHADFNVYKHLNVVRQLNLLIYLNDDWLPEYGGNLELWDKKMKRRAVEVAPLMGRAVVFTTTLDSFHGHPEPLNCPPERSRRSMALYYYSASKEGIEMLPQRTTTFQVRRNSDDKTDWVIRRAHLLDDWMPPAIRRLIRKARKKS